MHKTYGPLSLSSTAIKLSQAPLMKKNRVKPRLWT